MDEEKPVTIDLTTVPLTALAEELMRRRNEWLSVEKQLGLADTVAPVTPRSSRTTRAGTLDRRAGEKSLTWKIAQGERWLKSAKARGDKAGVQKYEQRVKELKKSAGGD